MENDLPTAAELVANMVQARRAADRELEIEAALELRRRFGISLSFAAERVDGDSLVVSAREAARLLGISARSLWAMTKCG